MKERDDGRLNKPPGNLLTILGYYRHQVIHCPIVNIIVVMVTIEEEQRRKHELALSRVMRLEQELARREEAVQGHSEEATQLKVLCVSDWLLCMSYL